MAPRELPRSYLPVLLNIQFTEPAILCVYIGLGVLAWRLCASRLRTDLLLYISLGFALPLFGLIVLNSTLYNNFRQVLFLIPPCSCSPRLLWSWCLATCIQNWVARYC